MVRFTNISNALSREAWVDMVAGRSRTKRLLRCTLLMGAGGVSCPVRSAQTSAWSAITCISTHTYPAPLQMRPIALRAVQSEWGASHPNRQR